MRRLWVTVSILGALALPAVARAADPLGLPCADQGDGIRLCQGKVKTFDGVPLDANLALPAGSGLPLVVLSHGWGGAKLAYADMRPWAQRGYAVLAFSARGFASRAAASPRASPTRSGARRGGCTSTTCVTRPGTSSSSRGCWPTRASSTSSAWA